MISNMKKDYLCIVALMDPTNNIDDKDIIWENDPNVFVMNKEIWKRYMKCDTDILTLFICTDEKLKNDEINYNENTHTLTVSGKHSIRPGLGEKFLKAIHFINENFNYKFLFRATLNTFIVFKYFKNILLNIEAKNVYYGPIVFNSFVSGCGILFSKDVIDIFINNSSYILNVLRTSNEYDDVFYAKFLNTFNIYPIESNSYCNIDFLPESTGQLQNIIHNNDINKIYQYRVKILANSNRLLNDSVTLVSLLHYYYPSM